MPGPLISVLLPVRDGGGLLGPAVRSILEQTEPDLELLLIDDHSSDQAIGRLGIEDARLRILPSKGRGIVAALNTGLGHARGRYLARMDADDISLPHRFSTQLGFMKKRPEIAIAGGRVELFSADGVAGGFLRYQDWINALVTPEDIRRELFVECPLPHPSLFMRKSTLLELGGYLEKPWAEDYDLLLRADAAGLSMGKPRATVLRWRDHPDRLSRTGMRYSTEAFVQARAHYLPGSRIHGREVVIWGAGPAGRALHDALREARVWVRAFLDVHPRRIGGSKRGLPVLHFQQHGEFPGAFILVAVGVPRARREIRDFLLQEGKQEMEQFIFVS